MTPDTLARLCGWIYVIASVCFIVASAIRARTLGAEPAVLNVDHVRSSVALARLGLVVDLASIVAFLITAVALYMLLVHVNQLAAAVMVLLVVIGVPVELAAVANEHTALTIATAPSAVSAAGASSADASAALLIDTQAGLRSIHDLIAGLWLLPLAYLVYVSGYFPKAIGILLVIAGIGWLIHLGIAILAPALERATSFVVLAAIGEVVFMVWLIVRGVDVPAAG